MGWVECVRDGLCPEAPPAAQGSGQLKDGREGGREGGGMPPPPRLLTGVREGAGCSCLPGEVTACAGPGVHCVPERVVQCRAELSSSLSCWSPPGCSSWGVRRGQAGLGLGWGSGLDMPAPLGSRCRPSLEPAVCQQLHRCALVLSPTSHGPGLPRHTAGRRQTRKFSSSVSDSTTSGSFPYTRPLLPFAWSGKACCKNRQCKNKQLFTFCSQRNMNLSTEETVT